LRFSRTIVAFRPFDARSRELYTLPERINGCVD
jgi:hypothetical protein